ncbi:hypothetical protein A1Q1_07160 [Trichosporon asahii var. asahii CBS 2479]|uniref:cAMP-independent regulatory protein n=1 Tax=Trichosporon asahii var. asahii (strain ATCC 90039 / CBS 2479 / JCM 2466 / KCTC 7840 / NBRC 103889/ NCYC 2677 / UAMH 7654) TaxID=1186058 RepID=J4UIT0_TRIAS|nr:hypothetical protein A1Q1_07160 [Trichosporon asahii var. asahii CBS 2479]EJT51610.1 hypothetical protein A1Q1_07160 [Trichosporon asahii var. asahii CBS 2479]
MYPSSSTQQPAAICALKSPADAIHILEAVRLGLVPRVTRRLTGHERSLIRPGTVWVWEEEETNMRRWTDGRRWGASRVGGGGFLVYTESSDSLSPPPPSRPDSPSYQGGSQSYYPNGGGRDGQSSTPPRRPEPLVKQTYSTSMTHPQTGKVKKFHVVAYSSKRNPQGDGANPLPLPQQLPNLAHIKIVPGIWPDWETRRDDYGVRRAPSTPHSHGSHLPLPPVGHPGHPHAPPHHIAGPSTPVTATAAAPFPPPKGYPHGPISPHHEMGPAVPYPPQHVPRGSPSEAHDRRYPTYYDQPQHPYDPHRPPYPPYDAYPPDRYPPGPPPDRYSYPYYPPGRVDAPPLPPHPAHAVSDYRYEEQRYYEERERELREREREIDPRSRSPRAGFYSAPPPIPPAGYYRDPRDPRDYRDPREMRDMRDPRDPRDYGRESTYPPRIQHLGKRPADDRPMTELPEPKRFPSWATAPPHVRRGPSLPPMPPHAEHSPTAHRESLPPPSSHGRHASGGSQGSSYVRVKEEYIDPREGVPRGPSQSPRYEGSSSVTLPPLRHAIQEGNERGRSPHPSGPTEC